MQRILESPTASPAALAEFAGGAYWKRYAHLQLLNEYLLKFAFGHIKRLAISMPPQHGKSELISHYFPAWYLGMFPDRRLVLTSYEANFARSWGRKARDVMEAFGEKLWGLSVRRDSKAANSWQLAGRRGSMMTAGVRGPVSGKPADCLIIDDPLKDAKEAQSKKIKKGTLEWWRGVARPRLSKGAGVLIVATRWAKDDLIGEVTRDQGKDKDQWTVLNLPAIAEKDERYGISWRRKKGEPLCEDLHPLSELLVTKGSTRAYFWSALYQGRPTVKGGKFFKRGWFKVSAELPGQYERMVRYWDKAATEASEDGEGDDPDFTVGVLMGLKEELNEDTGRLRRTYYVLDVVRVQENSRGVRSVMRQTSMIDGFDVEIRVEQEGGSSGKDVAVEFFDLFEGYAYQPEKVRVSKAIRADSYAAAVENAKVILKKAGWNTEFLEEHEDFPGGLHDDQVDAASGAFRTLQGATADIDIV